VKKGCVLGIKWRNIPLVILRHSEDSKRRSRVFVEPAKVWNEGGEWLRRAIAFGSRRRAASKSSQRAYMLVVVLRQIITGALRPAVGFLSPFLKHVVLSVMAAGIIEFGGIL
jgi:hypothetical protein